MKEPLLPDNEPARLHALRSLDILDKAPDPALDELTRLASAIAHTPIALISLIEQDRQVFRSRCGIDDDSAPRATSFCGHAIHGSEPFIIEDAHEDARFFDNPLVLGPPHVRFYAGIPLTVRQHRIGTLCVVDRVARELPAEKIEALQSLARHVESYLELHHRLFQGQVQALEQARSQRQVIDELHQSRELQERLSALVVHDLRSPLTVIMGNIRLLEMETPATPLTRTAVRDVVHSVEIMNGMLADLLDIGRSSNDRLIFKPQEFDIRALVERTCERMRPVLRAEDFTLDVRIKLRDSTIQGGPDLIRRVLQNLLDNGLKYAPRGSELVVQVTDLGDPPDGIRLTVSDSGPGVPDLYKERIFEAYARLDREATRHSRASRGLGLAFCRLAVESHGGTIWVEDRPGGGSQFCVELPRTVPHDSPAT